MTTDGTELVSLHYDPENRADTATKAGVTTSYVYDADGNRVEKLSPPPPATPTTGTLYWYMTPGIIGESDLSGTMKSEYIFFNGERVARRDNPGTPNAAVAYYFSDHLKTASVITDSAGVIKAESDYYPWGGELQFVNNDSNHYKFTGKERDSETNLDYFGARYYSNGLGRFITPDWAVKPVAVPYADFGYPQTLNLYTYCGNGPTRCVDKDGHFWPIVVAAIAVVAVAVTVYSNHHASMNKLAAKAGTAASSYKKAIDAALKGDAAGAQKNLDKFQKSDMPNVGKAAAGAVQSGSTVTGTLSGGLPGTGNVGTAVQFGENAVITSASDASSATFGETMTQIGADIKGLFTSGPTKNPFEPKEQQKDKGSQKQEENQSKQNNSHHKEEKTSFIFMYQELLSCNAPTVRA